MAISESKDPVNSVKLPVTTKLGFGVCDVGGNLFFTVIGFLLMNYLTDTVGLSAALAGTVVAIGKFWDAVTDPMAGYLSDRTKSRWGRRRPWILFGSFPLFITMAFMFINPHLQNQTLLFIWGVTAFCLLNTAYTVVNIPYNSLTPELTPDYNERTSLNGFRFGFAVVGTIIGGVGSYAIIDMFETKDAGYAAMGILFGIVMMVSALITFFSVKESDKYPELKKENIIASFIKVFKNKPYNIILGVYVMHIIGLTIIMGVAIYYFKYIHNNEALVQTAMAVMLLTAFIFIPISVLVSKKTGKKIVYAIGLSVFALSAMILFLFGHLFPPSFSLGVMVFSGMGLGFTYVMPWAIVPDTIEYNYLVTGERTEGAFYGMWTFCTKCGQALAMAITGAILTFVHYVPNVEQTPQSLFGIRLLLGPIPFVIYLGGVLLLIIYPITEKRYNAILEDIKKMEAKG